MKTKNVSFSGFGRILAWLFALITLLFGLAACGGGGGSTTPVVTHPPAPTPVVGNLSILVSPTNGATGVVPTSNIVLNYASSTNSYASSNATLTCDGTSIALAQSTDQAAKKVTFAPASVFPYGKTCIAQGSSTASGLDGGASTSVNWSTTFTTEQLVCPTGSVSTDGQSCIPVICPPGSVLTNGICTPVATAWWPPKNITPMGVKVLGTEFAQLTAGCTSVNQQCWKDAVVAKKVVFPTTTAKMIGAPGGWDVRPITFAGIVSATGNFQMLMMFADTGELVSTGADIDAQVISEGVDFVLGNELGYIVKLKSTSQCLQWHWNPPASTSGSANVWNYMSVTCPQ